MLFQAVAKERLLQSTNTGFSGHRMVEYFKACCKRLRIGFFIPKTLHTYKRHYMGLYLKFLLSAHSNNNITTEQQRKITRSLKEALKQISLS